MPVPNHNLDKAHRLELSWRARATKNVAVAEVNKRWDLKASNTLSGLNIMRPRRLELSNKAKPGMIVEMSGKSYNVSVLEAA